MAEPTVGLRLRGDLHRRDPGEDPRGSGRQPSHLPRPAELSALIQEAPDAVSTLHAAAMAWIDLAGDPVVQRILLIDGPSVVGWERWQAMDGQRAMGAMRAILTAVAEEGRLAPEFVDPFAHMVLAAMDQIALVIARSDDSAAAVSEGRAAVSELLRRITTP